MSNQKTQSILCILDGATPRADDYALFYAQKTSIEHDIPLAAVVCVSTIDDLQKLIPLELSLARINIPLLTLIGEPEPRIAATVYHLKPLKIFYQLNQQSSSTLIKHPIPWPGSIASVQELIDSKGLAC